MNMAIITTITLLYALLVTVYCQNPSVCTGHTDCNACIQASPLCTWCADVNFNSTQDRCYLRSEPIVCNNRQDPTGEVISQSNDVLDETNQISPRNVEVTARVGEPVSFTLQVRPARNYPLDVYFLMDLSASMNDDLANLRALGSEIASTIEAISSNFQLGFGSFIDKPVPPHSRTLESATPIYSYRHIVTLNEDSQAFENGISSLGTIGNSDFPEGGFDGFIQSIACTNLIGWRDNARHILLYITDAGFHYAGDGLLAGAVIPNSGECLMESQDGTDPLEYEFPARVDYPSVGLIREKLREFDIIPIFAAVQNFYDYYIALGQLLQDAEVGNLTSNSDNIVTLLNDSYTRATQRINPESDRVEGIDVIATPTVCPIISNNECNGVQIEQVAEFNVSITVTECTEQLQQGPQEVVIRSLGFGTVTVLVSAICDCDCTNQVVDNATECTGGNGALVCGTCLCNSGRFGDRCQCDDTGIADGMDTDCPENNGQMCSGRGSCVCGECQCRESFFGTACECDNFQCDRDPITGLICGGPNRGSCECDGSCTCRNSPISGLPYTGSACDCSPDNITCIDPAEPEFLCRGNGQCVCGECVCEGYIGQYCDRCVSLDICPTDLCSNASVCARCALDILSDECDACVDEIETIDTSETDISSSLTCDFLEQECEYRYYVTLDNDGEQMIQVDDNVACPSAPVAPWIIVLSIIAALLLLGAIILIAIKLILMLLDRLEVKKFLSEVQDPKFRKNENPLFESPNKKYDNPVYAQ